MFVFTYAVFYNFIHDGACSLKDFTGIVRWLIMTYGIVLIMQQICMLIGIRFFPIINLIGQGALSLSKLNSLSIEPSHSARILTALMLCYLRCHEISNGSNRLMLKELFSKGHRTLTFLFLWTMLTMGSGTAFIGLGILCLYFIQRKTWFYIVPLIALLLCIGQAMKLKQLDRATRIVNAVTTGDVKIVQRVPVKITFDEDISEYNIVPGMSVVPTVKVKKWQKKLKKRLKFSARKESALNCALTTIACLTTVLPASWKPRRKPARLLPARFSFRYALRSTLCFALRIPTRNPVSSLKCAFTNG